MPELPLQIVPEFTDIVGLTPEVIVAVEFDVHQLESVIDTE